MCVLLPSDGIFSVSNKSSWLLVLFRSARYLTDFLPAEFINYQKER